MKATGPDPARKDVRPRGRRAWLIVILTALALAALFWLTRRVDPRPAATTQAAPSPTTSHPNRAPGPANPTRSTAGLKLAEPDNILPDHRTAKEQKDEIVKQWGEFLNAEKARLGAATFDPLAKRWLERPRLQALIEEWKALEQAWPERSEQERDGQLPRIRAMWTEAMAEFAAELGAAGHPTTLPEPR
jgi:hypothetical protein